MKSITRVAAAACALPVVLTAAPALAQYANEFSIAKVTKQGRTSHSIAGPGTVKVQVQVNADGSHKVIKVLSSSNHGDDAAAMEIAQTSTYRPAHRGAKAIASFYDYVLKFNGKSVVNAAQGEAMQGAAGPIDAAIRAGHYDQAISKANAALAQSPGNAQIEQLLGIAQFYSKNYEDAAASFAKVDAIGKQFQPLAAQAYANAAVRLAVTKPDQALAYAQKAVGLANNSNSQFALGVAEIGDKQYARGIVVLKGVHDKATDPKTKLAIDRQLMVAYSATNDTAGSNATLAEMKQLDPSAAADAGARMSMNAGNAAVAAKNFTEALKDFDAAAQSGDPAIAVTANTMAAFSIFRMDKPDYAKAKEYATKAVTAAPSDPTANFAAGVAWAGVYASSHNASDKTQALSFLNKADSLAKAAGNTSLATQIENQLKAIPQ